MEPVTPIVASNPQIQTPPAGNPSVPQPPSPQQPQVIYAGFWRRFFALWIDGFIFVIIGVILILLLNLLTAIISPTLVTNVTFSPIRNDIISLIVLGFSIVYFLRSIGKYGQTLGKKALGIKVVDKTTMQPVGYVKAFFREYVGKFLSSLFFYLGFFWMLWDSQKQAWHDKIAGTVVVKV